VKSFALLGATGSIGRQTIEIVRSSNNEYRLLSLTAHRQIDALIPLIEEFSPEFVAIGENSRLHELQTRFPHVRFGVGDCALIDAALVCPNEKVTVINALVGMVGLVPTMKAIAANRDVLLANKETLVIGGELIRELRLTHDVKLYPIDSEHSALWQAIGSEDSSKVKKLILTASGGAFRDKAPSEVEYANKTDALKHPNWSMGAKITIDSATMINKGFELIEAHYLFDIPIAQIEAVIHRESIVHSMVEFVDGAVIAQLAVPDMKLPIAYAMNYPNRVAAMIPRLDFTKPMSLSFDKVNIGRYPCFHYALEAIEQGGLVPTVLNAANEAAVALFLDDQIVFGEIARIIRRALDESNVSAPLNLNTILATDRGVKAAIFGRYR
jgi:1-deoxy-D-xylulose-5-phosphate reductoisomerase